MGSAESSHRLVLVTWDDITSMSNWAPAGEVGTWDGFEFDHQCQTVGWLLAEEFDHVVVVACRTIDDKNANLAQRIPLGCVRSIVDLAVPGG